MLGLQRKKLIGVLAAAGALLGLVLLLSSDGSDEPPGEPDQPRQEVLGERESGGEEGPDDARRKRETGGAPAGAGGPDGEESQRARAAEIEPDAHEFAASPGRRDGPKDVTATNRGRRRIVLGQVSLAGDDAADFRMPSNGCQEATLLSGRKCTVEVAFAPRRSPERSGQRSANVVFSDDGSGRERTVALTGALTEPPLIDEVGPPAAESDPTP